MTFTKQYVSLGYSITFLSHLQIYSFGYDVFYLYRDEPSRYPPSWRLPSWRQFYILHSICTASEFLIQAVDDGRVPESTCFVGFCMLNFRKIRMHNCQLQTLQMFRTYCL